LPSSSPAKPPQTCWIIWNSCAPTLKPAAFDFGEPTADRMRAVRTAVIRGRVATPQPASRSGSGQAARRPPNFRLRRASEWPAPATGVFRLTRWSKQPIRHSTAPKLEAATGSRQLALRGGEAAAKPRAARWSTNIGTRLGEVATPINGGTSSPDHPFRAGTVTVPGSCVFASTTGRAVSPQ